MSNKKRLGKNGFQFEEEVIKTKALVLTPKLSSSRNGSSKTETNGGSSGSVTLHRSHEGRRDEATGLALAIDLDVVEALIVPVPHIKPATLFGGGKVTELKELINELDVELVIVDHALSPIQQRNLERELKAKVLDRTGLILEIFGRRARTKEGRLQVELAHLEYQKSRLVRSWTHLERQRGGVGFMGGPGETQIEADRRQLQGRILSIKNDLEQVRKTRELHRKGRRRVPYPIVALVGYTNAGKSTLFNYLTGADVHAEDLLFATLDPTMRELELPSGAKVIISDTVGFISDLPTHLIASFRATLEEVLEADLIMHVQDITHDDHIPQREDVNLVLKELGIDHEDADTNILHVWNKADLLSEEQLETVRYNAERSDKPVSVVSAGTGQGCDKLLEQIEKLMRVRDEVRDVKVFPHEGALLNWLYENADVLERHDSETGDMSCKVRVSLDKAGKLDALLEARDK